MGWVGEPELAVVFAGAAGSLAWQPAARQLVLTVGF